MKNRWDAPLDGWWANVPEISFTKQGWGFTALADELWAALQKNAGYRERFPHLPQSRAGVDDYLDHMNALRMAGRRGGENYIKADAPGGPAPNSPAPRPGVLRAAAGAISKFKAGLTLLEAWEVAGFPAVPPALAAQRAGVCLNCPKNELGHFTRWFTVPAAAEIKRRAEKLQALKLVTPLDDKLGTCSACLCVMTAKVQVPIEFIREHSAPGVREELWPPCWILKETN